MGVTSVIDDDSLAACVYHRVGKDHTEELQDMVQPAGNYNQALQYAA